MTVSLGKLRGVTPELRARLNDIGIRDSRQLLQVCRTPKTRRDIADYVNVDSQVILALANRADLSRVEGVGAVLSDLLEQVGVDTVAELATRDPEHLRAKLLTVNAEKHLAGRIPSVDMVRRWVTQARTLPRALEY